MNSVDGKPSRRHGWQWLFVIEFVLVLWPPFFNRMEPTLFGLPFFYWYQMAWVVLGALSTVIVYFATEK